jgi:hypothetical protein
MASTPTSPRFNHGNHTSNGELSPITSLFILLCLSLSFLDSICVGVWEDVEDVQASRIGKPVDAIGRRNRRKNVDASDVSASNERRRVRELKRGRMYGSEKSGGKTRRSLWIFVF